MFPGRDYEKIGGVKGFQTKLLLSEGHFKYNNAHHFPLLKEWDSKTFRKK